MRVFISHSESDSDFADRLADRLEQGGLSVWRDEEILPGDNLAKMVAEALEQSNAMIVLISPDAMKSKWVRNEINYALTSPRFEGRLVPIEVRKTQNIPWILRRFQRLRAGRDMDSLGDKVLARLATPGSN